MANPGNCKKKRRPGGKKLRSRLKMRKTKSFGRGYIRLGLLPNVKNHPGWTTLENIV